MLRCVSLHAALPCFPDLGPAGSGSGHSLGIGGQQFIDKHLARIGVMLHPCAVFNYLDTQIAMVESGEGIAIIPSFVLPACRNRKVV